MPSTKPRAVAAHTRRNGSDPAKHDPVNTGGGVYGDRKRPKTSRRAALHVADFNLMTFALTTQRLGRVPGPVATQLYARIMRMWTRRREQRVTVTLSPAEHMLLKEVGPAMLRLRVVGCPLWVIRYRNDELDKEVVVRTIQKPARRRRFRVPGKGKPFFEAIAAKRINVLQEDHAMAKTKTRKRNTKAAEADVDIDDELEGLEEDLDDLDDLDEPDAEVDDDEDEEEEKPRRKKRSRAKKSSSRKRSRKPAADEEEDDEDEEEEEEKPRRKRTRKPTAKKKGAKKGQPPPTRELPSGRFGASDIAEMAKTDGRTVRVFLRKNSDKYEKDEDLGRYSFTKKQAEQIAKRIKAEAAE